MSNVTVFGSLNEDLVLSVPRTPRPGETLLGSSASRLSGGKGANQAVAAARLGANVRMVGAVGHDDSGRRQLENLRTNDVDVAGVTQEPTDTGRAVVTVTDVGENCIVVVAGANDHVGAQHVGALESLLHEGDILVAQLELPSSVVAAALRVAQGCGALTILNAAPMTDLSDLVDAVDLLVINETEADALCGHHGLTAEDPPTVAKGLARRLGLSVVMTLGALGAVMADGEGVRQVPGRAVHVADTTGAGDTFVGALAAALASGRDPLAALDLANHAAALACTARGAQSAMPRPHDLLTRDAP